MADEIQALINLSITKNGVSASGSSSLSQTLAGVSYQSYILDVTLSAASSKQLVSIDSGIGTGGWIMLKNNLSDTSNTSTSAMITIANASTAGGTLAILGPTQAILLQNQAALYVAASGATAGTGTPIQLAVVVSEP
jgi:hypothetical protein